MCSLKKQACLTCLQAHTGICTSQHPFVAEEPTGNQVGCKVAKENMFRTTLARTQNMLGFEKDAYQCLPIKVTHQSLLLAGDRYGVVWSLLNKLFCMEISFCASWDNEEMPAVVSSMELALSATAQWWWVVTTFLSHCPWQPVSDPKASSEEQLIQPRSCKAFPIELRILGSMLSDHPVSSQSRRASEGEEGRGDSFCQQCAGFFSLDIHIPNSA